MHISVEVLNGRIRNWQMRMNHCKTRLMSPKSRLSTGIAQGSLDNYKFPINRTGPVAEDLLVRIISSQCRNLTFNSQFAPRLTRPEELPQESKLRPPWQRQIPSRLYATSTTLFSASANANVSQSSPPNSKSS
ncbi:hypothetical protein K439DRAFT_490678 [Ramaria rubella]|nr:hypothetical protein K439DRAFT_695487 [Ramaria rubella]KAF8578257.1 hypothetical protein K439DRAFT_490678 [Ramaria rubella]